MSKYKIEDSVIDNDLIQDIELYIKKHNIVCLNIVKECSIDFTKRVDKSFSEVLLKMIDDRNLIDVEVYKKANIDRRHFSKMRNRKYHPRKNTIIKLVFAMELDIENTNVLLKTAGYVLTTSDLRDIIIMYFIEHKEYDLFKVNDVLEYYNLEYI